MPTCHTGRAHADHRRPRPGYPCPQLTRGTDAFGVGRSATKLVSRKRTLSACANDIQLNRRRAPQRQRSAAFSTASAQGSQGSASARLGNVAKKASESSSRVAGESRMVSMSHSILVSSRPQSWQRRIARWSGDSHGRVERRARPSPRAKGRHSVERVTLVRLVMAGRTVPICDRLSDRPLAFGGFR